MTEDQAKSMAAILHADHDRVNGVWGVVVSRTDGSFVFISNESVTEYPNVDSLGAEGPFDRISLSPTRWDQAVSFAIERAEFEYLKAVKEGYPDPISIINAEEFEEVKDFSAPFDARNLKVSVMDRPSAIRWIDDADRPVLGAEGIENVRAGMMTLVVISMWRADVITRPAPSP